MTTGQSAQPIQFREGLYSVVPPAIEKPLEPYLLDIPDSPEEDAPPQEMPQPPEPFERQVLRASQSGSRVLWWDLDTGNFVFVEPISDARTKVLLGDYTFEEERPDCPAVDP